MPSFSPLSRGLLFACIGFFVAGCSKGVTDPQAAGSAPAMAHTGPPLTEEDCHAFGGKLETMVAAGDHAEVSRLLRMNDLFARALSDLGLSAGEKKAMLAGATKAGNEFPMKIINVVQEGGSYSLLRVRTVRGRPRVLLRLIHPDGSINYHEFTLVRYPDEAVAAEDVYIYVTGEPLSQTLRRLILGFMAGKSGVTNLNSEEQLLAKHLDDFNKLTALVRSGQNSEALQTFRRLPAELQKNKFLQIIAIQAAGGTGDDNDYITEMERFRKNHPNDASADLVSIDYYLLKKDYEESLNAIARLAKSLGGDPYLDVMRASTLSEAGKLNEARDFAEKAIKDEPKLAQAYWIRANVAVLEKNHDDTLQWLKIIVEKIEPTMNLEDLKADERFSEFVATPQGAEFQKWLAQRSP